MTINDILALTKAGFTKAEIIALSEAEKEGEAEAPKKEEPKKEPEPKQEEKPKKEPEPKQEEKKKEAVTNEDLLKMIQQMNRENVSYDVPPRKTVDDELSAHFMDLLGVREKETK